jgi:hypothetical protein
LATADERKNAHAGIFIEGDGEMTPADRRIAPMLSYLFNPLSDQARRAFREK